MSWHPLSRASTYRTHVYNIFREKVEGRCWGLLMPPQDVPCLRPLPHDPTVGPSLCPTTLQAGGNLCLWDPPATERHWGASSRQAGLLRSYPTLQRLLLRSPKWHLEADIAAVTQAWPCFPLSPSPSIGDAEQLEPRPPSACGAPGPLVAAALGSRAGPAAARTGCPAGEPSTSTGAGNDACSSNSVFSAKWNLLPRTKERPAPLRPGLDQLRAPVCRGICGCSSRASGKGTAWQGGRVLLGRPSQGQKRQLLANVPLSPC